MEAASGNGCAERMLEDLSSTCAVDPGLFIEACVELEVWEDYDFSYRFEWMCETFEDDGISAMHRFLDVAVCLEDGTLAEFLCSNDDGQVVVSHAVFHAAATVPLDEETLLIDRRAWFEEIARLLAADGQGGLPDWEE